MEALPTDTKFHKKRIELDLTKGGLNFLKPENQSFSIFINSFINCLKYTSEHPDTSIGLLFSHKHIPIHSLLSTFSFQTLIKHQKTFKELYPCDGGEYFEKAIEFFYDLEHDKTTSLHSPIFTSNFSNISLPFTKKDETTLLKANKLTIASTLQTRSIGSMILYLPIIKPDPHNTPHDPVPINKLSKVVEAFKPSFPTNNQYTVKKSNLVLIPLGTLFEKNKKMLCFSFQTLTQRQIRY
jgi:hypothetical protein